MGNRTTSDLSEQTKCVRHLLYYSLRTVTDANISSTIAHVPGVGHRFRSPGLSPSHQILRYGMEDRRIPNYYQEPDLLDRSPPLQERHLY